MSLEIVFSASIFHRQERIVQITIINDVFVENDEKLTSVLTVSTPSTQVNLDSDSASITILNNDGKE